MGEPLTADDLLPLVARLNPEERVRLLQLIAVFKFDNAIYTARPPRPEEFSSDEEPLAWDADGWEQFS